MHVGTTVYHRRFLNTFLTFLIYKWTGGVGVRHLLGYQKVGGSILGVGNFLAWKCRDFRDNSRLGKGTIPENSGLGTRTLTHFQIFRVGVGEFLGKLRSGNRYTKQMFKNPWRTPGYSKKLIQPTEGNCIPGQEKFDHWHPGCGPEQPVHFCHSVEIGKKRDWLVNYLDNKAQCRHLKKLTCKGTSKNCYKEPIYEVLSVCLHFGPFSHRNNVHWPFYEMKTFFFE